MVDSTDLPFNSLPFQDGLFLVFMAFSFYTLPKLSLFFTILKHVNNSYFYSLGFILPKKKKTLLFISKRGRPSTNESHV